MERYELAEWNSPEQNSRFIGGNFPAARVHHLSISKGRKSFKVVTEKYV